MKEIPVIILHGWASKIERWQPVVEEFKNAGFQVFLPSLPGFTPTAASRKPRLSVGEDEAPPRFNRGSTASEEEAPTLRDRGVFTKKELQKPWDLEDYAGWVKNYLEDNKIKDYLLLGHSFGGRIAVNLASKNPKELKGLILVDSGGIKPPLTLKKVLSFILAKTGKALFLLPPFCFFKKLTRFLLYKLLREKDYFLASPVMRKTLKKIISYDQKKELGRIKKPTLILWGANDKDTPISDGRLMNKKIKNSQFIVFPDASHGLPFQKTNRMVREILEFVKCL